MAKKKAAVNKSQLVRDYLSANPDASPTAVAKAIGHGVKPAYVSIIKSNEKKKARGTKTTRKRLTRKTAKRKVVRKKKPAAKGSQYDTLIAVKRLVLKQA